MMHRTLALLGCLAASSTACIIDTTPTYGPYEACKAGGTCTNGTTCTTAMYSVSGAPGNLCTVTCSAGPQCPVSPYYSTYLPTCVVSASTGFGLCYDTCLTNADCGGGTACALIPGTANRICVPAT
ncbi:MAG: hypothetical protein U0324_26585 [Polyangiales bacterium]